MLHGGVTMLPLTAHQGTNQFNNDRYHPVSRWCSVNTLYIFTTNHDRLYYGEGADVSIQWLLVEESIDGTCEWNAQEYIICGGIAMIVRLFLAVKRQLEADEDPSCVVDFWGKSRVRT